MIWWAQCHHEGPYDTGNMRVREGHVISEAEGERLEDAMLLTMEERTRSRECRRPLEAGKGRKTDSL